MQLSVIMLQNNCLNPTPQGVNPLLDTCAKGALLKWLLDQSFEGPAGHVNSNLKAAKWEDTGSLAVNLTCLTFFNL
jgi:hypothetical protein